MSAYLEHVRSLEGLHELIHGVQPGETRDVAANLIADVENAVSEIENHTRTIVSVVQSKAEMATQRITAEAAATVSNIKKETTTAAATLLRRSHDGADEKSAARAAGKILEEASVLSKELDLKAEETIALVSGSLEAAVNDVNGLRDGAIRDLAEIGQNAINELAGNAGDPDGTGQLDSAGGVSRTRIEETREALANEKRALVDAVDRVNRTVEGAYDQLNKCAKHAVARVEKAAREATASIERAIDDANGKILEVTESAISETLGADRVDHFNIDVLKNKWTKKRR